MYPDALLEAKKTRIAVNAAATVQEEIPAAAPPQYRAAAAQARLSLPLRSYDFLDFHREGTRIVVPVDALQFLDDLSILQAWLDRNGCREALLPNYVFRHASNSGRGRPMSPLAAFGIDRDAALRDSFIDDVSGKYYHTAIWFLLAHEVGHVAAGQGAAASVAQESAADAFALETMRRKHLPPVGILLYMIAISLSDGGNAARTHAANSARIRLVADGLRRSPQDFVALVSRQPDRDRATVLKIADQLSALAQTLGTIEQVEGRAAERGQPLAGIRDQVFPNIDYRKACAAR